jgi:adenylate cyclase
MRRVVSPLIVVAVVGATAAVVYRYLWDDPNEASVANYLRSGLHGMAVAVGGWGCHLYLSSPGSGWLRRWPLLAEVGLRAFAMAITIAAVIVGLQMVLYGQALETTWLLANFPGIFAMAFVLSVAFSTIFELTRLIGGRVLLHVILGRYRHPIREERVLMFLDLAGSTAMAEALGEVRMQELLTRFFFDIDGPILAHGGEVHAYVGDAVIVTWPFTAQDSGDRIQGDGVSTVSLPSKTGSRKARAPIGTSSAGSRGFGPLCMRVR